MPQNKPVPGLIAGQLRKTNVAAAAATIVIPQSKLDWAYEYEAIVAAAINFMCDGKYDELGKANEPDDSDEDPIHLHMRMFRFANDWDIPSLQDYAFKRFQDAYKALDPCEDDYIGLFQGLYRENDCKTRDRRMREWLADQVAATSQCLTWSVPYFVKYHELSTDIEVDVDAALERSGACQTSLDSLHCPQCQRCFQAEKLQEGESLMCVTCGKANMVLVEKK